MVQAQILIKAIIAQILKIQIWTKLPQAIYVLIKETESNIQFWKLPQLAFMILHAYMSRIESYTITRDMVYPRITPQGEQVIEPDWDKIRTLTQKMLDI